MKYYASMVHDKLNKEPFHPELITPNICLNPYYNTTLATKRKLKILLDSGAFQDVKSQQRLSFEKALQRQLNFEKNVGFISELIVSYDRLVDEKYDKQVGQIKKRVSFNTAEKYVEETIDAAKYLVDERSYLKGRNLLLSNQGVTVEQYVRCIKEVLKFSDKEDVIGFGGFCIIGLKPKYEPQYYDVLNEALPLIHDKGIKRIHVFGVGAFRPLVKTALMCKKYGIEPSYDTSTYEVRGVHGNMFNPYFDVLSQVFWKDEKFKKYHPSKLSIFNIMMAKKLWENKAKFIDEFWKELDNAEFI